MSNRKLVIDERDKDVLMGVIKGGCDPITKVVAGTIEDSLVSIPTFLLEVEEKWKTKPRNPTHVAPPEQKPKVEQAAKPIPGGKPAEELPLLSGKKGGKKAEEKTPATPGVTEVSPVVGKLEPKPGSEPQRVTAPEADQAPVKAEEPTEVKTEGSAEESTEVKTEGSAEESTEVKTEEKGTSEGKASTFMPTPAAPTAPAVSGQFVYMLKDGRGPFNTVQEAMDMMGLDKATRPAHNRWDRLSTSLKDSIRRVEKK